MSSSQAHNYSYESPPELQYPSSPSDSSYSTTPDPLGPNLPPSLASTSATCYPPSASGGDLGPLPLNSCRPRSTTKISVAHPYARLYAKKDEVKRRKIWNHALEKSLFNPYELSTMGAPQRRTIYISSLEAHIDRLHAQLNNLGLYPVALEELEPFRGLNSKTAKSIVAGLQYDASIARLKLLELERANEGLRKTLCEGLAPYNYLHN